MINALQAYTKIVCTQVRFNSVHCSIITTTITGTAAVGIQGKVTCPPCGLRKNLNDLQRSEEFDNSIMVIVDKVSFMNRPDFET